MLETDQHCDGHVDSHDRHRQRRYFQPRTRRFRNVERWANRTGCVGRGCPTSIACYLWTVMDFSSTYLAFAYTPLYITLARVINLVHSKLCCPCFVLILIGHPNITDRLFDGTFLMTLYSCFFFRVSSTYGTASTRFPSKPLRRW